MGWILRWCRMNAAILYWFQDRNLLGDDQISKDAGNSKRGRTKYHGGSSFFLYYQWKLLPYFIAVSPVTTLKERSLGSGLTTGLLYWTLRLRYWKNFKIFWTLIWTLIKYFKHWFPYLLYVWTQCEYPGMTANSKAQFCFDRIECLDFFIADH